MQRPPAAAGATPLAVPAPSACRTVVVLSCRTVSRALVPQLPPAKLAPAQWAVLLLCVLDGMESSNSTAPLAESLRLDSRQGALAYAVWAAVGRQPNHAQQTVRQLLAAGVVLVEVVPGWPDRERTADLRVCAEAKPRKLLWLHWHGLLPPVKRLPSGAFADGTSASVAGVKEGLHSMAVKLCLTKQLWDITVVINLARGLGVELALVSLSLTATLTAAVSDAASRADVQQVLRLSAAQELYRRSLECCALRGTAWQASPELVGWHAGVWHALNNMQQQAGSFSAAGGTVEPASGAADASSSSEGSRVGRRPAAFPTEGVLRLWKLAALALTRTIILEDANAPHMLDAVMSPA